VGGKELAICPQLLGVNLLEASAAAVSDERVNLCSRISKMSQMRGHWAT
jgi:hypothetical protein